MFASYTRGKQPTNMSEKNMSAQESLEFITSMIKQTQGNISENSFYLLIWGWTIAICNFGMYGLMKFYDPSDASLIWLLILPASFATMIYSIKHGNSKKVNTHLDKINMWLWIGMAIAIAPMWIFGSSINWMINAVILGPVGLATFVSGIILRFNPLIYGGIIFWISSILCYILPPADQYLVGGIAMVCGYLIPGYLLRKVDR